MNRTPDWEGYRVLVAIADHGSSSRAATELGISQPTVSRRIDDLERALALDRRAGDRNHLIALARDVANHDCSRPIEAPEIQQVLVVGRESYRRKALLLRERIEVGYCALGAIESRTRAHR